MPCVGWHLGDLGWGRATSDSAGVGWTGPQDKWGDAENVE
jgi:hypothetical protein